MAADSLFRDANMAAVTSYENTLGLNLTRLLYPLHVLSMFWFVKCMLHRTVKKFQWILRYFSLQVARI